MTLTGKVRLLGSTVALAVAASAGLAACTPSPDGSGNATQAAEVTEADIQAALKEPTTITFWSHLAGMEDVAKKFEEEHPAITVKVENPSTGAGGLTQPLRTALEAGTGIPDVTTFWDPGDVAPFVLTDDLANMAQYGAADLEADFVPGAWQSVAFAHGVWGIPTDLGPIGFMYREDILTAAGIETIPKTWDEFADAAAKVKQATGSYITNVSATAALGLVTQDSGPLFQWDGGKDLTVNIVNPQTKRFSEYWQKLIDADLVSTDMELTDSWFQNVASGKYATLTGPAWLPIFIEGAAANTSGKWRLAETPQWSAGKNAQANVGGSIISVLKESEHPLVAYAFARWFKNGVQTDSLGVFPAAVEPLEDEKWLATPSDFFGGQETNRVFADAASEIEFAGANPVSDFSATSRQDTIIAALAAKSSLLDGYQKWQDAVVEYAEQQGFTVNTGSK